MNNKGQSLLAIGLVMCLISVGTGVILYSCNAAGTVMKETMPSAVLAKYMWFKKQYTEIQAMEKNIQATQIRVDIFKKENGPMKSWDWNMKDEYSRISTVLAGQTQQYNALAAEYNQRASQINWSWAEGKYPKEVKEYK